MKQFEINLARTLIIPVRKRRLIYRGMLIYLLVSAGILTFSCWKACSDIQEALNYLHRNRAIQGQFHSLYTGSGSMAQYADRLQKQVAERTRQATAIKEALPADIHTVLPLLKVLVSQTDGSTLHRLTFIQKNDSRPAFEFSVSIPTNGRKSPGAGFLQTWQKNPELAQCFASITPATTSRGKSGNEDVFIMNYKVSFKE